VVTNYFTDVQNKRYSQAYAQQCADVRQQESPSEYATRVAATEPISRFQVGDVNIANVDLTVPVQVQYDDGTSGTLRVSLGQNRETGQFHVCGVEE
jgi:hypothetical protein